MNDNTGTLLSNNQQIESKSTTGILDTVQLTSFMSQVKFQLNIFAETRRQMNIYMAQDFSVFRYIRPDENRLSDIFADFLNPEGDHGQGKLFLNEFMDFIKLPPHVRSRLEDNEVLVTREKATDLLLSSHRRVDILLKFLPSGFMLGIENKPWTGDQPDQLSAYAKYLSIASNGQFSLVYAPPYVKKLDSKSLKPDEAAILKQQGQFVIFPYWDDLLNWLIACRKVCEAEKVRHFIQDLVGFIKEDVPFYVSEEGAI